MVTRGRNTSLIGGCCAGGCGTTALMVALLTVLTLFACLHGPLRTGREAALANARCRIRALPGSVGSDLRHTPALCAEELLGRPIASFLPATVAGSPSWMRRHGQPAAAVPREVARMRAPKHRATMSKRAKCRTRYARRPRKDPLERGASLCRRFAGDAPASLRNRHAGRPSTRGPPEPGALPTQCLAAPRPVTGADPTIAVSLAVAPPARLIHPSFDPPSVNCSLGRSASTPVAMPACANASPRRAWSLPWRPRWAGCSAEQGREGSENILEAGWKPEERNDPCGPIEERRGVRVGSVSACQGETNCAPPPWPMA